MYRKLGIVIFAGLAVAACHKAQTSDNTFNEAAAMNESAVPENMDNAAVNGAVATNAADNMAAPANSAAPAAQ